jgi:hypothetical protein
MTHLYSGQTPTATLALAMPSGPLTPALQDLTCS